MNRVMEHTLQEAQHNMERSILLITKVDRRLNECIRQHSKVTYKLKVMKERKWTWAGHISEVKGKRCTNQLTDLRPRDGNRV